MQLRIRSFIFGVVLATLPANAQPQGHAAQPPAQGRPAQRSTPASVYAPYQALIGEWDIVPRAGGPAVARSRFSWRSGNAYIWFDTAVAVNGRMVPHFEGMLVWNGVNRNLDMLVAIDLERGEVLERGMIYIAADGTFMRDHAAFYSEGQPLPDGSGRRAGPEGATVNFRQTFRSLGPDRMATSLTRQSASGWVANFPGSDDLVMVRRPSGG